MAAKIAVASTFSCELIGRWMAFWLERCGFDAGGTDVQFAAYGQLERELRSPLAFRDAACCVGLLRMVDWVHGDGEFDPERLRESLHIFTASLRAALGQVSRVCLIVCPARPLGPSAVAQARALDEATEELVAMGAREARLVVLDARSAFRSYAVADAHDAVADQLGHVPYTEPARCALGGAAVRGSLPALVARLKLVVVDCDYTLWHHAVGEVGAAAVAFAPRHALLHDRLRALAASGVLVALASRNEAEDVWAVLETAQAAAAGKATSTEAAAQATSAEATSAAATAEATAEAVMVGAAVEAAAMAAGSHTSSCCSARRR